MGASKATLKKDLRTNVSRTLEEVFKEFEPLIGKRKFRRNIKKATKILTANVRPAKAAEGRFKSTPLERKFDGDIPSPSNPLEITSEAAAL